MALTEFMMRKKSTSVPSYEWNNMGWICDFEDRRRLICTKFKLTQNLIYDEIKGFFLVFRIPFCRGRGFVLFSGLKKDSEFFVISKFMHTG